VALTLSQTLQLEPKNRKPMNLPTTAVVINRRRLNNKSGVYPVHLRITIGRTSKYERIPIPTNISMEQWIGEDDNWVRNTHPYYFEINIKIRERKQAVQNLIKRYYLAGRMPNFSDIFAVLKRSGHSESFNAFFAEYIRRPTDKLEPDTFKKYKACLEHLNNFKKNINFQDLNPEIIEDFYCYCRDAKGLQGSTIDSYFNAFKKVVRLARKSHLLTKEVEGELFEDLHIAVKKAKRSFLTIEEIKVWKSFKFAIEEKHLERDRDIFLLQIYTGYYYKDMINLKKEHLVKDHEHGYMILGQRTKNDEQTMIPLFKFPEAGPLIEKYASKAITDPWVFDRKVFLAEPVYNRQLKQIARKMLIQKEVSNKVARHTNAQLWIRLGTNRPIVSRMLGHSKEETTKIYYKIDINEVIDGTNHIDFEKIGI
jgi:site-specific recombinase XerD